MAIMHKANILLLFYLRLPVAIAQNVYTVTQSTLSTSASPAVSPLPETLPTTSNGGATPTPHDNAPGGGGGNNDNADDANMGGMFHYYFLFVALILCIWACAMFIFFRKRARRLARQRYNRESALQRDLSAGRGGSDTVTGRRRYWQGRWRSAEVSREEGLNEQGEAPPPYMPKTSEDERRSREDDGQAVDSQPAIPLQTLSREGAGLNSRPPDYSETHNDGRATQARNSVSSGTGASASGNRDREGGR